MLGILSILTLYEGVDLDSERYTLLPTVFPRGKLRAYAVHLTTKSTNTQLHYEPEKLQRLYNKGNNKGVYMRVCYISPEQIQMCVWKRPRETQQH